MTSDSEEPGNARSLPAVLAEQRRIAARGGSFRVEDLLERFPMFARDREALLDLIYNEVVLRQERGAAPTVSEYQGRFPELAGPLRDLFEVHAALEAVDEVDDQATEDVGPRRDLPPFDPSWPVLAGYQVLGELGRGGMGVVYRARDLRRDVIVAVKTMRLVEPAALYRFKREFRSLRDISHDNVVTLHELISDGRGWYIVMEFIAGKDFLRHVLDGAGPSGAASWEASATTLDRWDVADVQARQNEMEEASIGASFPDRARAATVEARTRLREALRQLAEGLLAIHRAGLLHRDLKPSNVLVTDSGRVVVMDFGLATDTRGGGHDASTEGQIVGTVAYMAPEQAAGLGLSEATDWYSVGVMLHQALTGRLPFVGPPLTVLMDKQRLDPAAPCELVPDVPQDLNSLCVELLRRDPLARPSGDVVLDRLGGPSDGRRPSASRPDQAPSDAGLFQLVGRETEVQALADALKAVRDGQTVVLFVRGPSGVGKSAVVRHFLEGLADREGAVVLAGRCHERESVPYVALDSLIDALSRHLRRLPEAEVRELMPRDVAALARVFPVLRRVEAVATAPSRGQEVPDPRELRRRAFLALRELLARLGDRRLLVLAIDDLQWGDLDSLAVLSEVLRPPDPPCLLLLGAARVETPGSNAFLKALEDWPEARALDHREVLIGPLAPEAARKLAAQWLAGDTSPRAEAVARESGGNPLFVLELARAVNSGAGPATTSGANLGLDDVLWARVTRLPEEARRLLEVIAIAGRPISPAIARECLDQTGDERAMLAVLRAGRLVRTVGAPGHGEGDPWVEPYHDRIRETIVGRIGEVEARRHHHRLALALEATGGADPEDLAVHFAGAGETQRAAVHYAQAAARAAGALAFTRAAALYRLAIESGPPDGPNTSTLLAAQGDALANAGRGAEAARSYLDACDGATVADALEYRRRAAMQFLISGHIDEGLSAVGSVLASVGMDLPRTPTLALLSLLWHRARVRLRGLGFQPKDVSQVAASELTRIDVCWSVAIGLSNVDWVRGADYQTRGLLLALKAGEPDRIARALAVEAAHVATGGVRTTARSTRLLERAASLSRGPGHPYATGMLALSRGVSSYLRGCWREALAACDEAAYVLREQCTGVAWELDTAHAYAMWALSHMGEWAEMSNRYPVLIAEARERGDLYAVMNMSTYIQSLVNIAADRPDEAMQVLERVAGQWSRKGYHVQHNDLVWGMLQVDLYRGRGRSAWERLRGHWPTLERSLLLQVQFIRVAMLGLRGRCALAGAIDAAGAPKRLRRQATKDANRLDRESMPWAAAQAELLRAGVAQGEGQPDAARRHLELSARLFQETGMSLARAVSDFLAGPGDRREQARAWMAAQAIECPESVVRMFAPGCGTVRR